MQISPTQDQVFAALEAFLMAVLPGLAGEAPAVFTGTIAGTTLTVTALPTVQPAGIQGTINLNAPLLGKGVAAGTLILEQLTGSPTGGVGTYEVSISQTVSDSITMATGVTVVEGQQNRVPEPANPYFVVATPIPTTRLATNQDSQQDVKFTGSLAAGVLTVSAVAFGTIQPGTTLFGVGVTAGTAIYRQLTGTTGGSGTYSVSGSQTLSSQTMSAGAMALMQESESHWQLDYHSADNQAGDFAQIVSTTLRDPFGTTFFAALPAPLNQVLPLLADDPHQVPYISDSNQWEFRWSADCRLQVDTTVVVPQQYADAVVVTVKDVSALYPP
jgi:hypothetical protein